VRYERRDARERDRPSDREARTAWVLAASDEAGKYREANAAKDTGCENP
jgi:hypothetical protein